MQYQINIGVGQNQGQRSNQEDYFATSNIENAEQNGFLAIIADGMGGHADGGKASILATNDFIREYLRKRSEDNVILNSLESALHQANYNVVQQNKKLGTNMGTTLTACVIYENNLYWVSAGDSCLFLYQGYELKKLNEEHSYGKILDKKLETGEITQQQADEKISKRTMLTSYLGIEELFERDLKQITGIDAGQKILLCSDGLTNVLTEGEILACLQSNASSQEKCDLLIQSALDKKIINQDNITIILLELNDKFETNCISYLGQYGKLILSSIISIVFLIVILLWWFNIFLNKIPLEQDDNIPDVYFVDPQQETFPKETEVDVRPEKIPNCALLRKEKNKATIKKLQSCLNEKLDDLKNLDEDGVFGENTDQAIKKFKVQYNIIPSNNAKLTSAFCKKINEICN